MMIGALTVLGWLSLGRLGIDLFPNVEFPYVAITTTQEGAGPDNLETQVTFAQALTEEQRWDVAAYILSLRETEREIGSTEASRKN